MAQLPQRILVPYDFSELSDRALGLARTLAEPLGAKVLVLHVGLSTTMFLSPFPDLAGFQMDAWTMARGDREEQALGRLEEALTDRQLLGGVELHYAEAEPAAAIEEAVRENQVDLVVMGSHGRVGVGRAVLGSVAETVARHLVQPVLLVK